MPSNDILPFATGANPNVITQAAYAALAARLNGFQAGIAQPAEVNKALRQASFVAAMLAQFTANKANVNVVDNGDLNAFEAQLLAAINGVAAQAIGAGNFATNPQLAAEASVRASADTTEAQARQAAVSSEANTRLAADNAEAAARQSGDTAEANARQSADNAEANTRQAADTAEANARAAADSNEASARNAGDQAIRALLPPLVPYNAFNQALQGNGYQTLPTGLIMQWGLCTMGNGQANVFNFNVTFPNAVFITIVNEANALGWGDGSQPTVFGAIPLSRSQFRASAVAMFDNGTSQFASGAAFNYIALGY